jgi:hypothetical protein
LTRIVGREITCLLAVLAAVTGLVGCGSASPTTHTAQLAVVASGTVTCETAGGCHALVAIRAADWTPSATWQPESGDGEFEIAMASAAGSGDVSGSGAGLADHLATGQYRLFAVIASGSGAASPDSSARAKWLTIGFCKADLGVAASTSTVSVGVVFNGAGCQIRITAG